VARLLSNARPDPTSGRQCDVSRTQQSPAPPRSRLLVIGTLKPALGRRTRPRRVSGLHPNGIRCACQLKTSQTHLMPAGDAGRTAGAERLARCPCKNGKAGPEDHPLPDCAYRKSDPGPAAAGFGQLRGEGLPETQCREGDGQIPRCPRPSMADCPSRKSRTFQEHGACAFPQTSAYRRSECCPCWLALSRHCSTHAPLFR